MSDDMNIKIEKYADYRLIRSGLYGKGSFVKTAENGELEIEQTLSGQDLYMSACLFSDADIRSEKNYSLYFCIISPDLGQTQESTIFACYYFAEYFAIPPDCIEVIYNGAANCGMGDHGGYDGDGGDGGDGDGDGGDGAGGDDAGGDSGGDDSGGDIALDNACKDSNNNDAPCEMLITIPPVVYGNLQSPHTPTINYHLARQMLKDGIKNIQIDVYEHCHMIRLPNSINTATSMYAIPLTFEELLYIDKSQIIKLSKFPRPENSMIIPRTVPEAVEWFTRQQDDLTKKQISQSRLLESMLKKGWQIPLCIRRLQNLYLYDSTRLEAYRIIAQFYSWIKASADEVWCQVQNSDQRNPINDYQKLKAIITFATENPSFAGCEHKLLKRFCPPGKCFIAELKDLNKEPLLFEK